MRGSGSDADGRGTARFKADVSMPAPQAVDEIFRAPISEATREGAKTMKINCLGCGHKVDLDDVYDDYEGTVRCYVCGKMMEIVTKEGRLKSVRCMVLPVRQAVEQTGIALE